MKMFDALGRGLGLYRLPVFGVMGDGNMFIVDSFIRNSGGTYVAAGHEAGAVIMANAFAQVSAKIGIATVTHGAGLTNSITALTNAAREKTPLLLLAGDTPTENLEHLQNISQRSFIDPTGAGFHAVRSPVTAVEDLQIAVRRAWNEDRPIVLNVPTNLQFEEVGYVPTTPYCPVLHEALPGAAALDRALGVLASARRPLILAGAGAFGHGAAEALVDLSARLGAPLATTLRAKDLFHGEPANIGVCGSYSTELALEVILESDCVAAFGASLNKWTTEDGALLRGKGVIQCDNDPANLGRFGSLDGPLLGDVRAVAEAMATSLAEARHEPASFRAEVARRIGAQEIEHLDPAFAKESDGLVDLRVALSYLDEILPSPRTLVTDAGRFHGETIRRMRASYPRGWIYSWRGMASIGLGMASAIGASLAKPDLPTVLVTGDGGFMLGGITEFNTAVRSNLDLIVIAINDGAYGAEYVKFREHSMDPSGALFDWPNLASLAIALGGQGFAVNQTEDLLTLPGVLSARQGPILIDIRVDPDRVPRHVS